MKSRTVQGWYRGQPLTPVAAPASERLTGHAPPAMMRSKESASGIPWDMPLLPERTES
jgi:hypothetical protein